MGLDASAINLIGSIVSAVGGVAKGTSALRGRSQASKEADLRLSASRIDADFTRKQAAVAARRSRAEGERLVGRQIALYGKAGVVAHAGTPLLVLEETLREAELDAMLALEAGEQEAQGIEFRGRLASAESRTRAQAKGLEAAGAFLFAGEPLLREAARRKRRTVLGFDVDPLE